MNRIAVFARNHAAHLDAACAIAKYDPSRSVMFRSSKLWSSAKKALDEQQLVKMYFSSVGSDGTIEYEAVLHSVVLNPDPHDETVQALLKMSTATTAGEGLSGNNDKGVRTLYVISHCKAIEPARQVHMTALLKASDQTPISANFKYSYVPVIESDPLEWPYYAYPEEISDNETYLEGSVRKAVVNAYERNPAARKACIAYFGSSCSVCDMNFQKVYGDLGSGFIHVHHLKMVSKIGQTYAIDPISDLRPVCPNCHSMLHAKSGDPYSIEELKSIVQIAKAAL